MRRKHRPRKLDLDKEETGSQICLVTQLPAWFLVTAYGQVMRVNINDAGAWAFYKEVTLSGEELLQVIRVS